MLPQVSVVIPTYNHSQYILDTLNSVFAQTYRDYKIIVINDGSPDDTSQVLQPLIAQNRIQYVEQENQGQSAARNRGLALARGEFIAFLDDDDLWPPDKLAWQVAHLQANPDVVFVGGAVQHIEDNGDLVGEESYHRKPLNFENLFLGSPFVSPGQILIRASALRNINGLDETLWGADDYDLWFRLARIGAIDVLPDLSLYYRMHPSNASKNTSRMFINCLRVVRSQLAQAPPAKRARLSRHIYRWLYLYLGREAVFNLRVHKLTPFDRARQDIERLSCFLIPMLRDPILLNHIVEDVTPNRLKPLSRFLKRPAK